MVDGIANPDVVTLQENTNQRTLGDPSDSAEVDITTYPISTHAQFSQAGSNFAGTPDFFIDWAVDKADLSTLGVTDSTQIRLIFGNSTNAQSLNADLVAPATDFTLTAAASDPVACDGTSCAVCSDNDGDGPTGCQENTLGTDPNSSDSDGDGRDDFVETDGGHATDTDGDGTIDALGTDPTLADTGGDGFDDGEEIDQNTDPLTPDGAPRLAGGPAEGCGCTSSGPPGPVHAAIPMLTLLGCWSWSRRSRRRRAER